MGRAQTNFNPFQPPEAREQPRLVLHEDDEFVISREAILCRETVELPQICLRNGDTDDLTPRRSTLRVLTRRSIIQLVGAAIAVLLFPLWQSVADAPVLQSRAVSVILMLGLIVAFGGVVWWSAKYGLHTVNVTWYIGGRYRHYLKWNRIIVRSLIVAAAVTLCVVVVVQTGETWPILPAFVGAAVLCIFYDPERKLQLVGKRGEAFVLRGHTREFHGAVIRQRM